MTDHERTLEELEDHMIWATIFHLYRIHYRSRRVYLYDYRYLCKRYGFKARVFGGWIFFSYLTDYETFKKQR